MQYLPPSEVPAVTRKRHSHGGPSVPSMAMETPSPILYNKRSRVDFEQGASTGGGGGAATDVSSVKKHKLDYQVW